MAGDEQSNPAEYRKPGNVDGVVVDDIAAFLGASKN
jgi:hypothetical protein